MSFQPCGANQTLECKPPKSTNSLCNHLKKAKRHGKVCPARTHAPQHLNEEAQPPVHRTAPDALEIRLVAHCAPALAGLKTANLFCVGACLAPALAQAIPLWNERLNPKGLRVRTLPARGRCTLVYVYRAHRLEADWQRPHVGAFLRRCGYGTLRAEQALDTLAARMRHTGGFPHEIGLFLGYPLEDVQGFIDHGGQHCKCVGCWKVYGDVQAAQRQFARFAKCKRVYLKHLLGGRTVQQLTVSA